MLILSFKHNANVERNAMMTYIIYLVYGQIFVEGINIVINVAAGVFWFFSNETFPLQSYFVDDDTPMSINFNLVVVLV